MQNKFCQNERSIHKIISFRLHSYGGTITPRRSHFSLHPPIQSFHPPIQYFVPPIQFSELQFQPIYYQKMDMVKTNVDQISNEFMSGNQSIMKRNMLQSFMRYRQNQTSLENILLNKTLMKSTEHTFIPEDAETRGISDLRTLNKRNYNSIDILEHSP